MIQLTLTIFIDERRFRLTQSGKGKKKRKQIVI